MFRGGGRLAVPLALSLLPLALTACGVGGAVRGLFAGPAVGAVDAHVVYRLRPDCPTLVARTTEHGYTVMTPLPDETGAVGLAVEETGLFEGPAREGQSVFRYIAPAASETWDAGGTDVVVDVVAVGLDLPAAHDRVTALCGPLVEGGPGADVPRVPRQ